MQKLKDVSICGEYQRLVDDCPRTCTYTKTQEKLNGKI